MPSPCFKGRLRKRLELLHELIPDAAVVAVLLNPDFSEAETQLKVVQTAADRLGQQMRVLNAGSEAEIDRAFAELIQPHQPLLVASDPFFFGLRDKLVALAARYAIPAIYFVREFTVAGGLIRYGASLSHTYHQMGVYSGSDSKGRQASRPASHAAHQVRIGVKSQDRQSTGTFSAADAASRRRGGD
jgi:putative tryptophan/tyrosine transport system substrate-binding protein